MYMLTCWSCDENHLCWVGEEGWEHSSSEWRRSIGYNVVIIIHAVYIFVSFVMLRNCMYCILNAVYSGTPQCGHAPTLLFVPIVAILYRTEIKTPVKSGRLLGSQWCPQ